MDIDLCGPSIPRMFGLQGNEVFIYSVIEKFKQ